MEKPKDYYQVLGVPRDATSATIKRAFRRLAKKYRPEVSADDGVEDFQELQAAYETLTDAERRRRYDETLGGGDRLAPLAWSFVRSPAAGDLRRPFSPGSLSGEILLTPSEAAAGGVLPLDVPVSATCQVCQGTGGTIFDCERCQGDGKVSRRLPVPVRIPPRVRDGEVFQVTTDDPVVPSILLTVHIRYF
jgi:DnaJ-class molecular chaperone